MDADNDEPELLYIKRKGGLVLLYNGYQFYRNKTYSSGSILWVCSKKKAEKCRGSFTIHEARISTCKTHSCIPDFHQNDIDNQFHLMKEAASKTLTPIKAIYDEHVTQLKDAGLEILKKIPTYNAVKSELFNKRKDGLKVKKLSYKSPMEVEIPPAFVPFMLADYACDDVRIIAFCLQEARKLIPTLTSFFGDGTFHSCPRSFQQLYTIHADIGSSTQFVNVVPVIYVLMSDQKATSYEIMLNMVKSQIPGFNPQQFMTDYELAAMRAIRKTFPQAVIKGCFYHYARALWKQAQKFKVTKAQSQKRIVALATALPFLPSYLIKDGWAYILNDMPDDDVGLAKFELYMERYWLKSDDFIAKWSIFGQLIRTTNCLEGWHSKINQLVGRRKPSLVSVLNVLKKDSDFYLIKMKGGLLEKRRKEVIRRDEFISNTNTMLIDLDMEVGFFLERLAWKGSLFKM